MRGGAKFLHHGIKRQQRYVAEAITEEWRMAPGPLEVARFAEETAAVERAVDALTKRLENWRLNDAVKYGAYISSFALFKLRT